MKTVRWLRWTDCDDRKLYVGDLINPENPRRTTHGYPGTLLPMLEKWSEYNAAGRTPERIVRLFEGNQTFNGIGFATDGIVEKMSWQLDLPSWHLWCDLSKLILHRRLVDLVD